MKIETKFNIGTKVWFIGNGYTAKENYIYSGEITTIAIIYRGKIFDKISCEKNYEIDCGFYALVPEEKLYATKEAAEENLKENSDE